jgi:hypothetical protein
MSAARRPAEVRRILAELAKLGPVLPGTVTRRFTRCGRQGCRCMADPPQPHGPYWSWTRKIDNKTVTRYLSDEQWDDYRPWFNNARRLRELTAELEAASLRVIDTDPRSTRSTPHKPKSPRSRPA